jgi:hypothetical protein
VDREYCAPFQSPAPSFQPSFPLFNCLIQNPHLMNYNPRPIIAHEGWIRFGSRVDVYPPLDAVVKVSIGDKVSATTTILAMLPQKG